MGTRLKAVVASFVLVIGVVVGVQAEAPKVLRVSAIPDENPQELLRIYEPFAAYLSKELGIPVKFVPVVDYAATVEGLAGNKLDLVWYGGFTSVQAVRQTGGHATRLVMRKEDAEFKSVFVTRSDSGIKQLSDLKGKTFSFGSVSSTSGHLMPRYFLLKNGMCVGSPQDVSRTIERFRAIGLDQLVFVPVIGWGHELQDVSLASVALTGAKVLPAFRSARP